MENRDIHDVLLGAGGDLQLCFVEAVEREIKSFGISSYPECLFYLRWRWYDFAADYSKSIEIIPQYLIGKYRVDFYVPDLKTAIEIDSFEFHERDIKQLEYERKRHREIEGSGIKIVRYAAIEILKKSALFAYELRWELWKKNNLLSKELKSKNEA